MQAVWIALSRVGVLIALLLGSTPVAASPTPPAGPAGAAQTGSAPAPSASAPADPPWLGVGIRDGVRGVHITEVIDDTPAYDAGIMPGDEVLSVAGTRVITVQALKTAVTGRQIAETVTVEVWRAGRVESLSVLLASKLSDSEILYRRLVGRSAPDLALPVIEPVSSLTSRSRVSSKFGSRTTATRVGRSRLGGQVSGLSGAAIEGLRGDVLVVYFFETSCRDCNSLHRPLSRLADSRRRDGLRVVAVSRQSNETLRRWAEHLSPSFTILRDSYGEVARSYRVEQLPALVVIDRRGDIVYAGTGGDDNLEHAVFAAERALVSERHGWAR